MEPQPQPQRLPLQIDSVDHLRYLIGQAQPGERLLVQIAPDISFEDVRMLWEAASLDGEPEGVHELFNPEMLRSKMMAADFIGIKVRELKRERDYLNGRIGCLQSWYNLKGRQLQNGGPKISESHEGLNFFGPEMYLDLSKLLKLRMEGLVALRDRISACIKYLEGLFTAHIDMGCGDADFTSFKDIGIGDIEEDVGHIIG